MSLLFDSLNFITVVYMIGSAKAHCSHGRLSFRLLASSTTDMFLSHLDNLRAGCVLHIMHATVWSYDYEVYSQCAHFGDKYPVSYVSKIRSYLFKTTASDLRERIPPAAHRSHYLPETAEVCSGVAQKSASDVILISQAFHVCTKTTMRHAPTRGEYC